MWVTQSLASWRPEEPGLRVRPTGSEPSNFLIRGGQRPSAVERVTAWSLGPGGPPSPPAYLGTLVLGRGWGRGHGPLLLGQLGSWLLWLAGESREPICHVSDISAAERGG